MGKWRISRADKERRLKKLRKPSTLRELRRRNLKKMSRERNRKEVLPKLEGRGKRLVGSDGKRGGRTGGRKEVVREKGEGGEVLAAGTVPGRKGAKGVKPGERRVGHGRDFLTEPHFFES